MDNMEGPLPPGKQAHPNWYDTLDRHQSVAFSAKGLRNAPGENNCFLNSAVQVSYTICRMLLFVSCLGIYICLKCKCPSSWYEIHVLPTKKLSKTGKA
jgi:hypothetical protein